MRQNRSAISLGTALLKVFRAANAGVLVIFEEAAVILVGAALRNRGDIADAAEFGGIVDLSLRGFLRFHRKPGTTPRSALCAGLMVLMPSILTESILALPPATERFPRYRSRHRPAWLAS